MSFDFIRIQGVVNDEIPLSEYLNNELRFKWAISSSGFSGPSWNILRRALMKFDFGGVEYPNDYIEIEILDQLTLRDLKQIKHAGTKRIELLLNELTNSSKEFKINYVESIPENNSYNGLLLYCPQQKNINIAGGSPGSLLINSENGFLFSKTAYSKFINPFVYE
jgi:hypothetical protein